MRIELNTYVDSYYTYGLIEAIKDSSDKDIEFHISSLGGDLDEGLKLYYALLEHPKNSVAIFKGRCASAATFLAMGAKKRRMYQNSHILIHKVLEYKFVYDALNSDDLTKLIADLEKSKQELEKLDVSLANIYYAKAKQKGKSVQQILNLMSKDTWMTASEALDWGFIDEVINEDVETDIALENALVNQYKLPKIDKNVSHETFNQKEEPMGLLEKIKNFFTKELELTNEKANEKANQFLVSFNEELKNEISAQVAAISKNTDLDASIAELKNEIGTQKTANADLKTVLTDLQTRFNDLAKDKLNSANPLSNVKTNGDASHKAAEVKKTFLERLKAEGVLA